jgi:hypothetical protein
VGFQACDPASDFRGAGALGLLNLYKFSSKASCQHLFSSIAAPFPGFFFCSAGLFLTMVACELVKTRRVGYQYWVCSGEEAIIDRFQLIYEMLFKEFGRFWLHCLDKSILYFNQNLKDFQAEVMGWSTKMLLKRIEGSGDD